MQHIDEALLHEYFDRSGESDPVLQEIETHLAGCAACRARLDEVSALRASARDILRAASPVQRPMPSFEEVAALMGAPIAPATSAANAASAATTAAGGKRSRPYGLPWAATIVLALGAGWMASSLYRSGAVDSIATEAVRQSSAPQSDAALQATAQTPAPPQLPGTESAVSTPAEVAAGEAAVPRAADATSGAGTATERIVAGGASGTAANAAIGGADMSAAREQTRRELPPAAPPPAAALAAAPTAAPTPSAKAAESGMAAERRNLSSRATVDVTTEDTASVNTLLRTTQWRTVSAESALRALGGSMVRARGLAVLDYAVARDNDRRVRVRQLTAGGDTLEVLQMLPPLVSALALAPSPSQPQIPEALLDARMYQSIARGAARNRVYNAMRWLDDRIVVFAGVREDSVTGLEPELVRTAGAAR